ncbi:MAG TPA: hypothetical protein DDW65_20540 [Firmicutes bacterium]|nr:hypothetical protein [Bacillota bacterium]
MPSKLFELSTREIKEYFQLFGQAISDDMSGQVGKISEGWITAVYLIAQRYCEIGRLEPGKSIEDLIETAIMSRYTAEETKILNSLCILDSFTPPQAIYITENPKSAGIIRKLSKDNSLIRYDERTDTYKLHHIFSGYLHQLLEEHFDGAALQKLYKRAGEWHIQNGDVLSGLAAFFKSGEFDLILVEFEKPGITKIVHRDPRFIVKLFEQIPSEVKYFHPIGYLNYANFYITNIDMKGGVELLARIEKYAMEDEALPPDLQRRISGEVEFFRSFMFFNDMEKMHQCHLRAYDLLDGNSIVASKDMIITYGSPHAIYLYYREKGKFRWVPEYLEREFRYYREVAGGSGTGFEELVWAEYYLETGDHAAAEHYARKAIYKAETMEQFAVIISADFTLARLYLALGKFAEAVELIDNLNAGVAEENSPVLNSAVDLCAGYIGAILNEPRLIAGWLKAGDIEQSRILYQGMGFNFIVHAKAVLQAGNYLKVEVLCEQMQKVFAKFNNIYGYLHTYIMDAAARYKLYGMEKAKKALEPALEIGRADGFVLPFAEYGLYILDILKVLQEKSGNDAYLDGLITEAARYTENVKLLACEKTTFEELTEREREVLRLVVEGQTNREIAAGLYIAEITVRKNITSIYRKLEVEGRAAAVKKTVEMKLT